MVVLMNFDPENNCYFDYVYQYKAMVFVVEHDIHNNYAVVDDEPLLFGGPGSAKLITDVIINKKTIEWNIINI